MHTASPFYRFRPVTKISFGDASNPVLPSKGAGDEVQPNVVALAKAFVKATKGLGRDHETLERILKTIGTHGLQAEFDQEVSKLHPEVANAMDLVHREFQGNGLEKFLLRAPYLRANDLFFKGKDTHSASDMQYRLEGIASIPMELFEALVKHPFPTVSIFATVAVLASFTPFGAAKLSNVITLMSLAGMVQNEWIAAHSPKGSKERAKALRHAGENWAGIGINALPMPEVVHHLEGGLDAIKNGYKGVRPALPHLAVAEAKGLFQKVMNLPKGALDLAIGLPNTLKEVALSLPAYVKTNANMLKDIGLYGVALPQKIASKGLAPELKQVGEAISAGFSYDSNFPQVATKVRESIKTKDVKLLLSTIKQALTAQIPLTLTLIDEIMFPFVKILQSVKGKGTQETLSS
jgi:hypothetical protein